MTCNHPQHQVVTPTGVSLADGEHDGLCAMIVQIEREAMEIATAVERAKAEIWDDIRRGTVPINVRTFSELHDYVDANMYGVEEESNLDLVPPVQDILDRWLREGRAAWTDPKGLLAPRCEACEQPARPGDTYCAGHARLMEYTDHERAGGIAANE